MPSSSSIECQDWPGGWLWKETQPCDYFPPNILKFNRIKTIPKSNRRQNWWRRKKSGEFNRDKVVSLLQPAQAHDSMCVLWPLVDHHSYFYESIAVDGVQNTWDNVFSYSKEKKEKKRVISLPLIATETGETLKPKIAWRLRCSL